MLDLKEGHMGGITRSIKENKKLAERLMVFAKPKKETGKDQLRDLEVTLEPFKRKVNQIIVQLQAGEDLKKFPLFNFVVSNEKKPAVATKVGEKIISTLKGKGWTVKNQGKDKGTLFFQAQAPKT